MCYRPEILLSNGRKEECLRKNSGIRIREILNITGTFDAELFKQKFDEDSLKLTNQGDEAETTDEGIDISPIYDVEFPVSVNSVKKKLGSRTKTERPISSWFLRQLLNSSNEGGRLKYHSEEFLSSF